MDEPKAHQIYIILQVMLFMATIAPLPLLASDARSESLRSSPRIGDEYKISKRYEASERTSDGSSGSSSGQNAILERVIGVREDGLELEFDLPKEATAEDRARSWQFPVRVFRPINGSMQLLNRSELEARIDGWLTAAGWTRAACGQWIFTWNAFLVECDPDSVIKMVEAFDLRSAGIRDGAAYQEPEAKVVGTLERKSAGPDGETFAVVMEIDPDAVRRARAESDVAVGEIMQKPLTLDAALRKRSKEDIFGTISITFDTDLDGNIRRRTKVTKVGIRGPENRTESQTLTETVERSPVPGLPSL